MKKNLSIFALALLMLAAGCDYFGVVVQPGPPPAQAGDPEVGGGQEPPGGGQAPLGGGQLDPLADEAGGGQMPVGGEGVLPQAATAPAQLAGETILLPLLTPGDSYQHGQVTFTLEQVRVESSGLVVHYTLSGLASDYAPAGSEPLVQMANGALLSPTGGAGGGGTPNGETNRYTFPALPPGKVEFTLLLGNQWSGQTEIWQVPVALKQLR